MRAYFEQSGKLVGRRPPEDDSELTKMRGYVNQITPRPDDIRRILESALGPNKFSVVSNGQFQSENRIVPIITVSVPERVGDSESSNSILYCWEVFVEIPDRIPISITQGYHESGERALRLSCLQAEVSEISSQWQTLNQVEDRDRASFNHLIRCQLGASNLLVDLFNKGIKLHKGSGDALAQPINREEVLKYHQKMDVPSYGPDRFLSTVSRRLDGGYDVVLCEFPKEHDRKIVAFENLLRKFYVFDRDGNPLDDNVEYLGDSKKIHPVDLSLKLEGCPKRDFYRIGIDMNNYVHVEHVSKWSNPIYSQHGDRILYVDMKQGRRFTFNPEGICRKTEKKKLALKSLKNTRILFIGQKRFRATSYSPNCFTGYKTPTTNKEVLQIDGKR